MDKTAIFMTIHDSIKMRRMMVRVWILRYGPVTSVVCPAWAGEWRVLSPVDSADWAGGESSVVRQQPGTSHRVNTRTTAVRQQHATTTTATALLVRYSVRVVRVTVTRGNVTYSCDTEGGL